MTEHWKPNTKNIDSLIRRVRAIQKKNKQYKSDTTILFYEDTGRIEIFPTHKAAQKKLLEIKKLLKR